MTETRLQSAMRPCPRLRVRSRRAPCLPAARAGAEGLALQVDGQASGLRVRRADGFLARAVGLLRASPRGGAEVLLIPRCAAIHTLGMRRSIDVAFVGVDGRVLQVAARLRPWRFAWCRGATSTWELPAGELERLRVSVGMRLAVAARAATPISGVPLAVERIHAHSMRGAAMLEFLVAGMLVLLPLTLATLELAQLAVARHALDYASFEAARAGAIHGGDRGAMQRALARALVPLFAPVDPVATLRAGAQAPMGGEQGAATALARAAAEALRPDLTRLEIENPTAAAARDFAVIEAGERVIPNDGLELRNPLGPTSGQSLREANVLAIRVRHCRRLVMPLVDRVVPALLRLRLLDPFDQLCLAQRRVPIEARAVLHMQSPLRVAQLDGV